MRFIVLVGIVMAALIIGGCVPQLERQPPQINPPKVPEPFPRPTVQPPISPLPAAQPAQDSSVPHACKDAACFIDAANACLDMEVNLDQPEGSFHYASRNCTITKTLVKISDENPEEIRQLLEGKSMTCRYPKGDFQSQWVTTLMFGMEHCKGELREKLAWLLAFTS